MKKRLLYSLLLLCICGVVSQAQLKDTLTFRVFMGIQMQDQNFMPASGDTVRVVGSFNNWSTTDTTVRMTRHSGSDSEWVLTRNLDTSSTASVYDHNDTLFYKFYINRNNNYEGVSNRVYALVNGTHSTPIIYFNDDSTAHAPVNVTFRVNMSIKWREGVFLPPGDVVLVPGDFNGWSTTADTLKKDVSDSIFTKTRTAPANTVIHYKFYKTPVRGGLDWEGNQPTASTNREYTVPATGGTLPVVWFNNDSTYVATVTTNIFFETDMSAFTTIGWFVPAYDSIQIRGSFEGWSGTKATPDIVVGSRWQYTATGQILPVSSEVDYKFYMKLDSAHAVARFPGLIPGAGGNSDGFYYEHPIPRGDGNIQFIVANQTNQSSALHWYSDVNPSGLLKNTTDSVNVTLKVNMGPATRYSNPFNPSTDTLYLIWQDALWRSAQQHNQGSFNANMKMTRQGVSDSVWTVTFKVKGKAHYGMMYTYQYRKPDASIVDQGGGLGGQNLFIARFIQATNSSNVWPASYTAPTDVWQKNAPLPGESAQFTTGVAAKSPGPPGSFTLFQNYPNPFNPTTNIQYTLPITSPVRLRVYNLLGQMIEELVNNPSQTAGTHVVGFDASRLTTGVYFYKLEAGSYTDVKKMILLK